MIICFYSKFFVQKMTPDKKKLLKIYNVNILYENLDRKKVSIYDLWNKKSICINCFDLFTYVFNHIFFRRVYITMGKKVAVAQMNGYFLLVLADVIVPTRVPECTKS